MFVFPTVLYQHAFFNVATETPVDNEFTPSPDLIGEPSISELETNDHDSATLPVANVSNVYEEISLPPSNQRLAPPVPQRISENSFFFPAGMACAKYTCRYTVKIGQINGSIRNYM